MKKMFLLLMFTLFLGFVTHAQNVPKLTFEYHYSTDNDCKLIDALQMDKEFCKTFNVVTVLIKTDDVAEELRVVNKACTDSYPYAYIREANTNVRLLTLFGSINSKTVIDLCKLKLTPDYIADVVPKIRMHNKDADK